MRYLLLSVLVVCMIGILMVSNAFAVQDRGDFYVVYVPSENYQDYEVWIKNGMNHSPSFFDNLADLLNHVFKLPYDIPIFFYECGSTNAYYNSDTKEIIICYELVKDWHNKLSRHYQASPDSINYATLGSTHYVLFHELGHAFIDIYDLKITGLEEDVADQFAFYLLQQMAIPEQTKRDVIISAAVVWYESHSNAQLQSSVFADNHSLNIQRYYNFICWIYGSDPTYNASLVGSGIVDLPEHRAQNCVREYNQIVNVWDAHIAPIYQTSTTGSVTTTQQQTQQQTQQETQQQTQQSKGGGCLIATAAFGSEMAPQVQFLREIRDNTVLQTESGSAFMTGFNQFYYSFSPAIADYERENPVFKEAVKITLTPLLASLTLLQYADIDSESEMLGYGIGIILLNIGMYFVAPAILLSTCIRKMPSKNN